MKNKSERAKSIIKKFEQKLPDIWEKARLNEEQLAKEYIANLRSENAKNSQEEFAISVCVKCGCTDVPSTFLEIPVNLNGIMRMEVFGAKCSNPDCGEEYHDPQDIGVIRRLEKYYEHKDHYSPMSGFNVPLKEDEIE